MIHRNSEPTMDIKAALRKEHSQRMAMTIVDYIGDNKHLFNELMQIFSENDYRIIQRASWPMSIVIEKHPSFIKPWYPKLIEWLQNPNFHIAVKRNIVRLLQNVDIPDNYIGQIIELCFGYLRNEKEAIAVQAFAMQVIMNATKKFPELGFELRECIMHLMPNGSAGIRNRGQKIIHQLNAIERGKNSINFL